MTHGLQVSRDVIDAFYTKWKWTDLCGAIERFPFTGKTLPGETVEENTTGLFQLLPSGPNPVFLLSKSGGVDGARMSEIQQSRR